MAKPLQIIELEKYLGFELTEIKNPEDTDSIINSKEGKTFLLDYFGQNVIGLNLFDCQLTSISFLRNYPNLLYLNLGNNKITDISDLKELTQIEWLRLYSNEVTNISALKNCASLTFLDLKFNPITYISVLKNHTFLEHLDLFETKVQDFSILQEITSLQCLDLRYSHITRLYFLKSLKILKELKLTNITSKNQVKKLKKIISLEHLEIRHSKVDSILLFKSLTNLISLDIDSDSIIDIPPHFIQYFPNLKYLDLSSSSVRNIPKEITNHENSLPLLKAYFQDGETHGWDENKDLKIILIGNGGVGKTSLVRRLVENKFDKEYDSTHGIQLEQYTDLQPYHINIWDFGGQDIYHATHRLFMKTRALFVLVWDWQTEQEPTQKIKENNRINEYQNHDLNYWLNYVKVLGKGSKVIVVQTKMQKHGEKKHPRENELRAKYQDIWLSTISIDSEENDWDLNGFEILKTAIKKAIKTTDWQRKEQLPKNWITQRKEVYNLLKSDTKTIDYEYFVNEMCQDNPISPETILSWLSDSGVVFYQKGFFENKIIINQQWAIDAVYTLFDRENVYFDFLQNKKGRFSKKDIQKVWKSFQEHEQDLFLSFMLSCEICFQQGNEYIAPALLPTEKEGGSLADFWEGKFFDTEKYEFAFLHYGVIQSFIVRLNNFRSESISIESVWQYGILFKYNNLFASVKADLQEKTILVNVSQSEDQSLLNKIQNLIYELDDKKNITVTFHGASNTQRKENEEDRFADKIAKKVVDKMKSQISDLQTGQDLLIEEIIENYTILKKVDETTIRTEQSVHRIEQTLNEKYQEFKEQFQTIITKTNHISNQIEDFDERITSNLAQLDAKFEIIVGYYIDNLLELNKGKRIKLFCN